MNAYLVLTICSVAASLTVAIPLSTIPDRNPGVEIYFIKRENRAATNESPMDLNQMCELLKSNDQRAECLEYVRRHVKSVPEDHEKDRGKLEKAPLDLQVFVPSENSWYLQDSSNPKFLGKPVVNVDKRPEGNLDVGSKGPIARAIDLEKPDNRAATNESPIDLNQMCELLKSNDQRAECLEYVRRHVKSVPEDHEKDRGKLEKAPLDLQVFVPSENSWYLQDSKNHKFLGKPAESADKRPEGNLDVGSNGERRAQTTLVYL